MRCGKTKEQKNCKQKGKIGLRHKRKENSVRLVILNLYVVSQRKKEEISISFKNWFFIYPQKSNIFLAGKKLF